jgi:cell division septum initiation protein DivIVA
MTAVDSFDSDAPSAPEPDTTIIDLPTLNAGSQLDGPLFDAEADAQRIRDEARIDSDRIRALAAADARQIRTEARESARRLDLETRADAERVLADASAQAERIREDADRVSHEAEERARRILEDAEYTARQAREDAGAAASRMREEAELERQRILHEARTLAETETTRLAAEAQADGERTRAAAEADGRRLRDEAELDAQRIRELAELDRTRIVEEARAQAYYEANHIREDGARQARRVMLRVAPTTTPIHSSEISSRDFPRAMRGFDPAAVSKWLTLVEQSYSLVEDELERRRMAADDVMEALGEMRSRLASAASAADAAQAGHELLAAKSAWSRAVDVANTGLGGTRLGFDTLAVRTALMETPLRRRVLGYSRDQVRNLLEVSAAQLARLENQLHLTHAENERLRSLFLEQIADAPAGALGAGDSGG